MITQWLCRLWLLIVSCAENLGYGELFDLWILVNAAVTSSARIRASFEGTDFCKSIPSSRSRTSHTIYIVRLIAFLIADVIRWLRWPLCSYALVRCSQSQRFGLTSKHPDLL